MYIHPTILKVKPEGVVKVIDYLKRLENTTFCTSLKGIRQAYLIESQEEAGKLISLTFWDAPSDASSLFANPDYARPLVGFSQFLYAPPERISCTLLDPCRAPCWAPCPQTFGR